MKIGAHEVGPGHPVFIVAEGGSNHGGSLDAALALTDAAANAGANAMKWQLWLSADEMYDRAQFPEEWAVADRYRLPVEWLPKLRDRAHERGMAFGLSSFGFGSLDEADKWVDFHKIASIESQWAGLLLRVLHKRKPTLISTGMSDVDGVPNDWDSDLDIVPLHCVIAYPADLSAVHLRSHECTTPEQRWGLSDHTRHPTIAPCAAVALGACVIEKHIRPCDFNFECEYSSGFFGRPDFPPDWNHSLTHHEFAEMVSAIRLTEQALGSSEKRIRPSEEKYLRYRRGPRGLRGA